MDPGAGRYVDGSATPPSLCNGTDTGSSPAAGPTCPGAARSPARRPARHQPRRSSPVSNRAQSAFFNRGVDGKHSNNTDSTADPAPSELSFALHAMNLGGLMGAMIKTDVDFVDELTDSFTELGSDIGDLDRKSTRLNSSHVKISYAVFCLKKKKRRQ